MFRKLFGETIEDQLAFLRLRVIITIIPLIILIASLFSETQLSASIAIIFLFVWGWPAVKNLFGITALATIFIGNIVVGIVLFILYMLVSYIFGIIVAVIGVCRYIYLKFVVCKRGN